MRARWAASSSPNATGQDLAVIARQAAVRRRHRHRGEEDKDAGIKVAVFEGLAAGDKDFNALISGAEESRRAVRLLRRLHTRNRPCCCARPSRPGCGVMVPEGVGNRKSPRRSADAWKACGHDPAARLRVIPSEQGLIDAFKAMEPGSESGLRPARLPAVTDRAGIEKAGEPTGRRSPRPCANTFEILTGNLGSIMRRATEELRLHPSTRAQDATCTEVKYSSLAVRSLRHHRGFVAAPGNSASGGPQGQAKTGSVHLRTGARLSPPPAAEFAAPDRDGFWQRSGPTPASRTSTCRGNGGRLARESFSARDLSLPTTIG